MVVTIHTRMALGGDRYQMTASLEAEEAAPVAGATTPFDGMGTVVVESVRIVRHNLRFRPDEDLFDIVVRVLEPDRRLANL